MKSKLMIVLLTLGLLLSGGVGVAPALAAKDKTPTTQKTHHGKHKKHHRGHKKKHHEKVKLNKKAHEKKKAKKNKTTKA
jgi:hypothetical protein